MLPHVRLFYDGSSEYQWADGAGRSHTIRQAEGGEQGDSPMPMLYALGQRGGLEEAQQRLPGSDVLVVFWMTFICAIEQAKHANPLTSRRVVFAGIVASTSTWVSAVLGAAPGARPRTEYGNWARRCGRGTRRPEKTTSLFWALPWGPCNG